MSKVNGEAVGDRVTIQEAAHRLGVKDDAVRKRIQRGTLRHEKDSDGRVYVFLDATQDVSQDNTHYPTGNMSQDSHNETSKDDSKDKLINVLHDQIQYLKEIIEARDRELEVRTDELKRKDTIIMSLTQRLPELSPASSPEDLGTSNGTIRPSSGATDTTAKGSPSAMKKRWWHKLIGS